MWLQAGNETPTQRRLPAYQHHQRSDCQSKITLNQVCALDRHKPALTACLRQNFINNVYRACMLLWNPEKSELLPKSILPVKINWLILSCGFLGGNKKFAEIRAGSLSRLAASPLDCVLQREPARRLPRNWNLTVTVVKGCKFELSVKWWKIWLWFDSYQVTKLTTSAVTWEVPDNCRLSCWLYNKSVWNEDTSLIACPSCSTERAKLSNSACLLFNWALRKFLSLPSDNNSRVAFLKWTPFSLTWVFFNTTPLY